MPSREGHPRVHEAMAKPSNPTGARSFERDLTELAREGRLPLTHGMDEEIGTLLALIARGGQHVLLAGEPGVGKTARVHGLARRIGSASTGEPLAGARVVEISIRAFFIWAGKQEEMGQRWAELMERLEALPGLTVVAVRDAGVLVGTGLLAGVADSLRS